MATLTKELLNNSHIPHAKGSRSVRSFVNVKIANGPPQKIPIIKGQLKASDLQSL